MASAEGCRLVRKICDESFNLFKWLHESDIYIGIYNKSQYRAEQAEQLKQKLDSIKTLFRNLRLVYEDCNRNGKIDDQEIKDVLFSDSQINSTQIDNGKDGLEKEYQQLQEQLKEKNHQLKIIIDQLREIVWQINAFSI